MFTTTKSWLAPCLGKTTDMRETSGVLRCTYDAPIKNSPSSPAFDDEVSEASRPRSSR
jgi:hypothetical protein